MPRIKLTLPGSSVPWTKAPNTLLDHLLPSLKDTELRVVLVLLRQTVGWNREERIVTISYQTLMKRTGRQSEAVARALRSLKARGVIHMARAPTQLAAQKPKTVSSETEGQQ